MKKLIIFLVPAIIVVIIILLLLVSRGEHDQSLSLGSVVQPMTFPEAQINYPEDWPLILLFPDRFTIVKANKGNLPNQGNKGYVLWMRYEDKSSEAQDDLLKQLEINDWEFEESTILDSDRYISIIINQGWGTGIAIVEPDPDIEGQSIISITGIRNSQ